MPIAIPKEVKITYNNRHLVIKGIKGELSMDIDRYIDLDINDDVIVVSRQNERKPVKSMHGTTRSLIQSMIVGVSKGIRKELELVGVGYRVKLEGKKLNLSLGFSHPSIVNPVEGVEFAVEGQNKIIVTGIDKQLVGQVAASIRRLRPPEPYKGKGIRYVGEVIIKKAGKTAKSD